MNRTCSGCKETKDSGLFYKRTPYRPTEDNYDYYCKTCRNSAVKKTFRTNKVKCTEQDCDKPNYARHLCRMHYDRSIRKERRIKK